MTTIQMMIDLKKKKRSNGHEGLVLLHGTADKRYFWMKYFGVACPSVSMDLQGSVCKLGEGGCVCACV